MNKNGKTSPTAFIPFCSFGKHLTGVKAHGFDVPICNIFEPKVLYDQLCYETDLEKLKDNNDHNNLLNQLKVGLVLLLDYNKDTNVDLKNNSKKESDEKQIFYEDIDNPTSIFLDTISRHYVNWWSCKKFFLDPVELIGEGQYNLNTLKEIVVTDSFLGLPEKDKSCQNVETYDDCITRHSLLKP